jgi:hypothetical protein
MIERSFLRTLMGFIVMIASSEGASAARVRHVTVQGDQIVLVKTALGVATIIQVPDKPNSVVVGDQGAFKVEYLDQAVTIKPLRQSAKSNLYIYTDWRRFSTQLVTGGESSADYVVYLEPAVAGRQKSKLKEVGPGIHWKQFGRQASDGALRWKLTRLGQTRTRLSEASTLWIEIELSSSSKEAVAAESFWLTQSEKVRPIHALQLSAIEIQPGRPIRGVIQIRKADVSGPGQLRLELRRAHLKTLSVSLPKESLWN